MCWTILRGAWVPGHWWGHWRMQRETLQRCEIINWYSPMYVLYQPAIFTVIIISNVVEAHSYIVDIGQTDREQIRSRINNNWCRTFRPHRPLSTAYKTVLYAVDKGLRGRNALHQLLLILLGICSRSVRPIIISLASCVAVSDNIINIRTSLLRCLSPLHNLPPCPLSSAWLLQSVAMQNTSICAMLHMQWSNVSAFNQQSHYAYIYKSPLD